MHRFAAGFLLGSNASKDGGHRRGVLISSLETALVEEPLLLWRGDAAERRVAVRKASEAPNDVGVDFRPFQTIGIADCLEECGGALLIGEIFRMLKRQLEEAAHAVRRLRVEAAH